MFVDHVRGVAELDASLRQLREPDAFPAGDLGLQRAMKIEDGQQLLERAKAWRRMNS